MATSPMDPLCRSSSQQHAEQPSSISQARSGMQGQPGNNLIRPRLPGYDQRSVL